MSNMSINSSAQNEINELENYIKNQSTNYRNNSLVSGVDGADLKSIMAAKEKKAAEIMSQKRTVENLPSASKYDNDVKVELSEAGKLKAENATANASTLEDANRSVYLRGDVDALRRSKLFEINSNAREAKTYPEYEEAFEKVSSGFKKAYATQTIGKYADSGIRTDEVDLSYVARLNALYDKLREEIKGVADEEEQTARMKSLDDSYQRVFDKNIVNPLKSQYDSQFSFYKNGALMRKDSQMIESHKGLTEVGNLYDALLDRNNWHNSDYMKGVIGRLTDAIVSNAKSK